MKSLNPYLAPILDEINRYLSAYPLTNEHALIKHLQNKKIPPFDHFSLAQTQDLFSAHFLCMHALYHLKKQYQGENNFALVIESVRVQRISINASLSSEEVPPTALNTLDPMESYYLNAEHYFETQEDDINDMLKSFWQKYIAQDSKKEALEVLELPFNADPQMVKKQYLSLVRTHHPDKGGCAEMFNKIRQAKIVLDKCL